MIPIGEGSRAPIFPIVTYAIIAANVYVFFQEFSAPDTDAFINAFAAIPYDITHDIVLPPPSPPIPGLTLLSSMFLHGGLLHIFFNMLFLAVFGPEIEYLCGHVRYLIFYLVCGLLGGFAHVAVGCFPLFLRLPAILVIGLWALTQFINGFGAISERAAEAEGGIAYFAHIGGFLAGVILIGFFRIRNPSGRRFRYYY